MTTLRAGFAAGEVAHTPGLRRGVMIGGLCLILCYQLAYWPLGSEFNIRYAVLGIPLALLALLMAPGAMRPMFREHRLVLMITIAFFLLAAIACINSRDPAVAALRWVSYLGHAALAIAGFIATSVLGVTLRQVLLCIGFSCCVLCLAELASIAENWLLFSHLGEGRIYRPTYFNHIRNFAHVPTVLFIIATGIALLTGRRTARWIAYGFSTFSLCLIAWAGGRVSLIILPLAAGLLLFLVPAGERLRKAGIIVLLAVLALALVKVSGRDQMWGHMSARMKSDLQVLSDTSRGDLAGGHDSPGLGALGSGRLQLWRIAHHGFVRHPFIGSGGEAFLLMQLGPGVDPFTVNAHPHNWAVRLALEYGLAGVLLIAGALIAWGRNVRQRCRRAQSDDRRIAGLAVVVPLILAAYGLLSGTLYYAWSLNVAVLCVGALAGFAGGGQSLRSA